MNALDDVMDRPAKRGFHAKLLIACGGGPFLDGYVMSIIGVALIGVREQLTPSTGEIALIGAASLVGIFVGAGLFGFLTDRIGREKIYALDLISLVVFCGLSAFVQDAWQLVVLRFLIGAAVGADYPVATSLLTEFTPTRRRGVMVGMAAVAWNAGAATAYLVGASVIGFAGGNDHWRWLLFSSALLGVAVVLLRRGIPESPRWLLKQERFLEAEAVVEKIYGVKADLRSLQVKELDKPKIGLGIFLKGQYLRRLIMCVALYLAVVTPLYAILTYLPTLLAGFSIPESGSAGLIVETVIVGLGFLGSIPAVFLMEKWGRRRLTVLPLGLMTLPFIGLWLWSNGPLWFIVLAFCSYMLLSGAPGILVWIYPNELFPTEVRATAVGLATALSRIGAATGIYLLPLSMASLGVGTTMLFAGLLTGAAFLVCLALAPETKGRSLEEASAVDAHAAVGLQGQLDSDLPSASRYKSTSDLS